MRLAITGGTGFVGTALLDAAIGAGHHVSALTRRPRSPQPGITWIEGALDRPESLAALVNGAEAIIHVAGVVRGDEAAFRLGNVAGTEAIVAAAVRAGVPRFVHVSSLAAREPALSAYGASKAASERPVTAGSAGWTIVRPPAVYGPGDRDMLELFRFARGGIVPLPARGRLSVIHVADLARLLLACAGRPDSAGHLFEPDDGREGGWTHAAFASALGDAVGRRVLPLPLPRALVALASRAERLLRGDAARLTADRVAYLTHPDWAASPERRPPAALWAPAVPTGAGLAETARWYRAQGWLRPQARRNRLASRAHSG